MPTIMSLPDVADLLALDHPAAARLTGRRDFPQPIGTLDAGDARVWSATAVTTWGVLTGRLDRAAGTTP
jgi:hypothetical protein